MRLFGNGGLRFFEIEVKHPSWINIKRGGELVFTYAFDLDEAFLWLCPF